MKHISIDHGQDTNLLQLTTAQLYELEPFLNKLGIRVRDVQYCGGVHVIQAENPYKGWISREDRRIADEEMSPDGLRRYKY